MGQNPSSLASVFFGLLGCSKKSWKVACLWHVEANQLGQIFLPPVSRGKYPILHKLGLFLPNYIWSWEKEKRTWLAEKTRKPSIAKAAPASLLLPPLGAAASILHRGSWMQAMESSSPFSAPRIDSYPFGRVSPPCFLNLFPGIYAGRAFMDL